MVNKLNIKAYSSEIERYKGSVTANWQAGAADLVTIGANDDGKLVDSLLVDISALTATATISIRLYQQVNGTEKCILDDDYIVGTDPQAIPVINSPLGIYEAFRVEVQSDNALDNGLAIGYEYTLEEK
ncbi:MAG: hypothetical protein A9183_00730 [Dehalococcoides mccartyi]|uniref:hypothetical protein n=1 Tax=Dehalococcoides mccartyi TaxID=61435 RepID=UPI0008050E03|nr:hypothetical protein [Dehalococcoides mccartyi]OBW62934.1 MAG: hypothetical protein A9183_00730 [Dehalococcoides mccartyi]